DRTIRLRCPALEDRTRFWVDRLRITQVAVVQLQDVASIWAMKTAHDTHLALPPIFPAPLLRTNRSRVVPGAPAHQARRDGSHPRHATRVRTACPPPR